MIFLLYLGMSKENKKRKRITKSNVILKQPSVTAKIKVRLDERTTVTIHSMSALKLWKVKYPGAHVIDTKVA